MWCGLASPPCPCACSTLVNGSRMACLRLLRGTRRAHQQGPCSVRPQPSACSLQPARRRLAGMLERARLAGCCFYTASLPLA